MELNDLSRITIGLAMEVHKALGPGLLESAYEECLFYELQTSGLYVEKQKILPLKYKEIEIDKGYRIDLMIENKLIVELKAVEAINDVHLAQILTYLKLTNCQLGLLINFNVTLLKHRVKRVVNNFEE